MYRVQLTPETLPVSPVLSELGIRVVINESAGQGWRFRLETNERDNLAELWQYCREEDIQFEVEMLRNSAAQPVNERGRVKTALTDRQQQVARVATQMGYYDKGGPSAKDVAAELDMAPSTLSTHLRRINAKIYYALFATEPE